VTPRNRFLASLAAALLLTAAHAGGASAQGGRPQYVHLDVSTQDGTVAGHADLSVVRAGGGFRVTGSVTDEQYSRGCVTLKLVEMRFGMDFGGDTVTKVCGHGQSVAVDARTGHHQVVLQVDEPGSVDFESRIVTLTG
jgi:hypothetical protein